MASSVTNFTNEVDKGNTTTDSVRIGAFVLGEWREFFRAVDDGAEALLRVVDDGEVVDERLEFFGKGHTEK